VNEPVASPTQDKTLRLSINSHTGDVGNMPVDQTLSAKCAPAGKKRG